MYMLSLHNKMWGGDTSASDKKKGLGHAQFAQHKSSSKIYSKNKKGISHFLNWRKGTKNGFLVVLAKYFCSNRYYKK